MPYVVVRGNLISGDYGNVVVSGLKPAEITQLKNFKCTGLVDTNSVSFRQHPCVILNALEVVGYRVVTSATSNTAGEYAWTLRKEFANPEPDYDN